MRNELNPFFTAQAQIERAIGTLTIPEDEKENLKQILLEPKKVFLVNLLIKLDSGKYRAFVGFRSQHNNAKGPYKGGIRFHTGVTLDEVKALSMWMSIKTSVIDLPLGGGKGGIICNPKELSKDELERLSRAYIGAIYKNIGQNTDIPAPDVNTNGQVMAWMTDEYSKLTGENTPGCFTGKPLELGGSLGRPEATGYGGVKVLETFLQKISKSFVAHPLAGKRVVIQGFGNVGSYAAERLINKKAKVLAISDSKGGIKSIEDEGFSENEMEMFIFEKQNRKISLIDLAKEREMKVIEITNGELLEIECDVLIPSALENVITTENEKNIKAKYILELANGPVTEIAEIDLFKRDVIVIPDVLANSGGVLVSYFEQVQNKQDYYWTKEEVIEKMDKILERETKKIIDDELIEMLRTKAYAIAIKRIYKTLKLKGEI